ncbi:MAG TPA: fatty acid CoA ligase family protein [Pirellulaceae bacterium]|nr:fatty acid CoA ligase family protein [Pirellulaceae bacterium]HMO92179.1 fatty acid CoA ligase family protein [Pirellulaceae bacterium]HMP68894.1 fatty acid CoA ligase family protein [Pirellulaceae bacterium]
MDVKGAERNNVAELLSYSARHWPEHPAVAEPLGSAWDSITFAELDRQSDQIAKGLIARGLRPGTRIALLVPAGIQFVKWVFALFKARSVVILIDPGMGKQNLIRCLSAAEPAGFVGIRKAHLARLIYRHHFPHARFNVLVQGRYWPGCITERRLRQTTSTDSLPSGHANEPAAIIFTTGSTGPPKGVLYSHCNFLHQAEEIRNYFQIEALGADISGFPLFALFNSSMGKTTVFPKMDFTRPASIDPQNFIQAVEHWQATQAFGSPALLNTLGRYCEKTGTKLRGLKRVLSAGAPVPPHVLRRMKSCIADDGEVFTPYGATEALPVACNSATQVLGETAELTARGQGVCVGKRFPGIEWQIIEITDDPITSIQATKSLDAGQIGELLVSGPVVTTEYVTRTEANALHKVHDQNRVWHRMGDVGYLDDQDRFWMCGRKSHRVTTETITLFTIPCEAIFNTHPHIYRSALVGLGEPGKQVPAIVAEPWPEHWPQSSVAHDKLLGELKGLANANKLTDQIQQFYLKRELPTDIRHNSKIFREQLSSWIAQQARK